MILHLIPEQVDGCAYHRIAIPMHNLNGFEIAQSTVLDGISDEDLKRCSLVVMSRDSAVSNIPAQIKRLKELGLPYVVDIDDFWQLDHKHLAHEDFKNGVAERWIQLMKGAAAVTTTQSRLAVKILKFNKNVVLVPNAIDANQPQWGYYDTGNVEPVYGWVGGAHHLADLEQLRTTFKRIHKENIINLALGGYTPNEVYFVYDIWMGGSGTYKKYERIPARNVYTYGHIYDKIDVCLIPLLDNRFNACKSNLKLLEAGFKNRPAICSKVAPYIDDFKDEVLWVENRHEWYNSIMKLHNNPSLLFDLKEKLAESVQRFEIKKVNHIREQLYTTLINGK